MITPIDVLLVEDNPADQELTLRAFKKHNLSNNIFVVEDGAEALDFIFAKGKYTERGADSFPKVILLDLKLPKISGLDVLKEIKNNDETKTIPVVVLTSSKEEKDIVESYRLGVNSYIVKPVVFEKFLKSIQEIGLYWLLINQPPK